MLLVGFYVVIFSKVTMQQDMDLFSHVAKAALLPDSKFAKLRLQEDFSKILYVLILNLFASIQ